LCSVAGHGGYDSCKIRRRHRSKCEQFEKEYAIQG
jgi:hypothetical protein